MLTRRLEKINTMCEVLKEFASAHKDAIDTKGLNELANLHEKAGNALSLIIGDRSFIIEGRSNRNEAFVKLQNAILEARRAIDLVAVRDCKPFETPNFGTWIRNSLKIKELAARYIEALDAAGSDPVLDRAINNLKTALDEYGKAHGVVTQKVFESRSCNRELEQKVAEFEGKFKSLCSYAAYNVLSEERRILLALLRDTTQKNRQVASKNGKKETSGTKTPDTTTTQAVA